MIEGDSVSNICEFTTTLSQYRDKTRKIALMTRVAFADESGTDGKAPCYAIGVISCDAGCLKGFEEFFRDKLLSHGVLGEGKWKKVKNSHGLINFALDALDAILGSKSGSFDTIVVNTALYRNWNSPLMTREEAFYKTYTLLLRHIASRANLPSEIFIDDRSDSYPKRHEVMENIGNHMLAQLASAGRLTGVHKVDSRQHVGIQVADLLTGAVNAAHARRINPRLPLHSGKRVALDRLAQMLGWDDLCYDTMPSDKFNIWHFPIEYRAVPKTRPIMRATEIPYVSPVDLLRASEHAPETAANSRKSA